jgi:hypothetical protein
MKLALFRAAVAAIGSVSLYGQTALTISTTSLPNAAVGASYSATLAAAGGTAPYFWTAAGSLPLGLSLSSGGTIGGTPASAGSFTFAVTVFDARQSAASRQFTLSVSGSGASGPGALSISTGALPGATAGQTYSQQLAASGGTPPYQWIASAGLPSGVTLSSSGVLSGTPGSSGSFSFQVQVTDNARNTASANLTLTVSPAALAILTQSPIFNGTAGASYAQTFSATGGAPPYTWSISSGSPGAGLKLDSASGILQGTPQSAGTFPFTVQVNDSRGVSASASFSLVVNAAALVITAGGSLPGATVGAAYSQKVPVSVSGGTPPYTWSVSAGFVPGLIFDPGSLTLSGTPTTSGTFQFTLLATDSAGLTASRVFPLAVSPASLSISTARQLPNAELGSPFSQFIAATGGAPPYTWSAAGLPAGLAINPSSGAITGTPTAAGTFNPVVITVVDSALNHYSDNFSLTVTLPAAPAVTITGLPATAAAAQQYTLEIDLEDAYPAEIDGQAILTFAPDSGPADSSVLFASGGTTAAFTIPAGSTTASASVPLAVQTGTVSGILTVSLRLQSGGADITPTMAPSASAQILKAAPVIRSAQVTRGSNTISIAVTGYSTAREVTQAVFQFQAASGQSLQQAASSITVDVGSLFGGWFSSSPQGSQFVFTQPFTVQGDPNAVIPVSVTLTNRIGSTTFAITQ